MHGRLTIILLLLSSTVLLQCSNNPVGSDTDDGITPDIVVSNLDETIVIGYDRSVLIEEKNYGGCSEIILNVYAYFTDVSENKVSVSYTRDWITESNRFSEKRGF